MAASKKKVAHTCAAKINRLLRTRNARLVGALRLTRGPQAIFVATEKVDTTLPNKAGFLAANFCPFCGVSMVPS